MTKLPTFRDGEPLHTGTEPAWTCSPEGTDCLAMIADFSVEKLEVPGCVFRFIDQSTPSNGETITTWEWDFGDGTTSTEQNPPDHTYDDVGQDYTVTLAITDSGECTAEKSKTAGCLCTVRAVFDSVETATECEFQFTDNSIPHAGSEIESWLWDFGDGATSNEQNPLHLFTPHPPGREVTLTVTDALGCEDLVTARVNCVDCPACSGTSVTPLRAHLTGVTEGDVSPCGACVKFNNVTIELDDSGFPCVGNAFPNLDKPCDPPDFPSFRRLTRVDVVTQQDGTFFGFPPGIYTIGIVEINGRHAALFEQKYAEVGETATCAVLAARSSVLDVWPPQSSPDFCAFPAGARMHVTWA